MSVLDQRYRRWEGQPTPYWQRMLVIARYDILEILSKKAWAVFYVISLLPPLIYGLIIYGVANFATLIKLVPQLSGLAGLKVSLPGADWWVVLAAIQSIAIVAFAVLVGPPLATRDFANGAIPLYLSKALRRSEYVLGRWAILLILLSAASWVPLTIVFGLEMALADAAWRAENAWILGAILVGMIPSVLLLTALISAVSAHVHRSNLARLTVIGLVLVTWPLGKILEETTGTPLAQAVSPMAMAVRVNQWAYTPPEPERAEREVVDIVAPNSPANQDPLVPVPLALLVLAGWFSACLMVLSRRVRAVEVVK